MAKADGHNEQCTMDNVQWKKVKLGDVCHPSNEKYNPLSEHEFQFCVEMENINQESGTLNGRSDISKLLSLKNKFQKGDVLYGKLRPYLKKFWLADYDGVCSTEIWVLKNADYIDNQFLFYLFQSENINRIANFSSGTKMPRADWQFMAKQDVDIPFENGNPSLPAQRRIAAILSAADKVIDSTRRLIEKYKKMKQGMMEELLNEQCTMNNVQWKKVRLGEVGDFYVGGDVDRSCFSPYPTVECRFPIYANALVNEGLYGYSNKYEFDKEAVTITGRGDVGKVFYRKPYFSTIIRLVTLIPTDSNIDVKFLSYAMSRINFIIESTGVPQLTAPQAKKYEVSIPYKNGNPDLAEQRRIAAILSGIDAKIAAEEKVLEKYEKVKKGLMERLLNEKF